MVFQKTVVVDGRGHLLGRLASLVAKQLLQGQNVVIVRCEDVNISGSLVRNKIKFAAFLRKRTLTNPKRGPIHYRAPSKIVWRVIRGMLPRKVERGDLALQRLKTFEGIPPPYSRMKRMVVPDALRVTHLRPGRRFCVIGRLSNDVGWRHWELIKSLEEKRKAASKEFYEKKKAAATLKAKAVAAADLTAVNTTLAQYGY